MSGLKFTVLDVISFLPDSQSGHKKIYSGLTGETKIPHTESGEPARKYLQDNFAAELVLKNHETKDTKQ